MDPSPDLAKAVRTPYLDRELPLPRENKRFAKIKKWQAVLLVLTLGVYPIQVIYAILLLVILVHEMGHLLAGLLVGDKFHSVRIGPLKIKQHWNICWVWNWRALFSGGTVTLPVSCEGIRWKLFVSTLAGPAANFITGWATFSFLEGNSIPSGFGIFFSATSFFIAVANLAPQPSSGLMSDGMRLWVLLFSKRRRERLLAILTPKSGLRGTEANDLTAKVLLEDASTMDDGSIYHVSANFATYRLQEDYDAAAQYLETCLANCSVSTPELREELIIEAGEFHALRRNRPDLAREWLSLETSGTPRLSRLFVEALILNCEGKPQETISKIDQALSFIQQTPANPLRDRQPQAFQKWRSELQEKSAPTPESNTLPDGKKE